MTGSSRRVMVESGGLACLTVMTEAVPSSSGGLALFKAEARWSGWVRISVPAEEFVPLLPREEEVSDEGRSR